MQTSVCCDPSEAPWFSSCAPLTAGVYPTLLFSRPRPPARPPTIRSMSIRRSSRSPPAGRRSSARCWQLVEDSAATGKRA